MTLFSVVAFLLIFTLLVLVHELGHFLAARLFGVKVEEFAIGLPPRATSRIGKSGTRFSLNWLPLGGFVRLKGEGEDSNDTDALSSKPAWQKTVVSIAGVAMNLVLAWLVIAIGFWASMPPLVGSANDYHPKSLDAEVIFLGVQEGSPAALSGIQPGDILLSIQGQTTNDPETVRTVINASNGQPIALTINRAGEQKDIILTPQKTDSGYQAGFFIDQNVKRVQYNPGMVPIYALQETFASVAEVAKAFWTLILGIFTQAPIPSDLSGPVGIARISGTVVMLGFYATLQFISLLSINLAVLNILPFPALDGGRLIISLGESVTRRRIKPEVENAIHTAGFLLLLVLIAYISYKDIVKLF